MIAGTPEWLVRSLSDWAVDMRQGVALVTYKSRPAREQVLSALRTRLLEKNLLTESLQCAKMPAAEFVASVVSNQADVLFVLDPDDVFSTDNHESAFWVNFSREAIVERPGVQIWWMSPDGATRFAQLLPDLNRFFLFREELETEAPQLPAIPTRDPDRTVTASPGFGQMLLNRAMKAAAIKGSDKQAVWLQLAIPALDGLIKEGNLNAAIPALAQITLLAGLPEEALQMAAAQRNPREIAFAFQVLGQVVMAGGDLKAARQRFEQGLEILQRLANANPTSAQAQRDLIVSYAKLADMTGEQNWWRKALEIAEQLNRSGRLAPNDMRMLGDLRQRVIGPAQTP